MNESKGNQLVKRYAPSTLAPVNKANHAINQLEVFLIQVGTIASMVPLAPVPNKAILTIMKAKW